MKDSTLITNSTDETIELAERLAARLKGGDVIALIGDLGAGKTVFVKGLAKGLGIPHHLYVNSPSFVILKEYHGRLDLYHFDVYRLDFKDFADTVDHERYFYGNGVSVIEWADKVTDILPEEYLEIRISQAGESKREFVFKAFGERYEKLTRKLEQA